MKPHLLGCGEYPADERALHHRLAARYRQSAIERTERRRKVAKAVNDLLRRDVGPILQVPGIRIVAIGAAQQATGREQDDAQPWPVIARGRLVGMHITEGAFTGI